MFRDAYGRVVVEERDLIEKIYVDPDFVFDKISVDPETQKKYNQSLDDLHVKAPRLGTNEFLGEDYSVEEFDRDNQAQWHMPPKYQEIDVWEYLAKKMSEHSDNGLFDTERLDRALKEMNMFEERGLTPLLRYLIYFVETMRENQVLMGVGRGSSVASYVLYLIGVHRIDSFKYNLDITEFLK